MKKILAFLLGVIILLSLAGCDVKNESDGKISVVATAFPHYDIARSITAGIDNVEIKMLVPPGNEVHTYEPSPSDILAISTCDLFICTGGESETWVKDILASSDNDSVTVVSFMDLCADSIAEHQEEHGDHTHTYDEHVWTAPSKYLYLAHAVKNILIGMDGKNVDRYIANGKALEHAVYEAVTAFAEAINNGVRDGIVVADRFPFYYLAEEFGFKYTAAYPGCSHSTEPSAKVISSLAEKVKNEDIPYVFTIEFSNQKIAKSVIEGTDAGILELHSCHNVSKEDFDSGITYAELMMRNAANIRKALCE